MTNIKTEVEAESTEAAQLAQHALEAAITAIREWQDDLGLCEAPFRITLHVDNGNEADREVSGPHDEANEALRRAAETHDRYTGRNGWIRHEGGECPVHPLDVIDIYCPTSFVERDTARDLPWNIAVFYRHLRDPDGIPYCSAEGLEDWAEYVVTGSLRIPEQHTVEPEPGIFGNWLPKGNWSVAPTTFTNTRDHWTETKRRVWRPEVTVWLT